MSNMSDSYSSIKFSTFYSINRLKTYLEEWISTETGYIYKMEKVDERNQILLYWDNNIQGIKIFFLVSWSNDIENQIMIDLKAWITVNPSLFKSTKMTLNLKGFLKFFQRKRALMQFIDLITFLKGNPGNVIHQKSESSRFYNTLVIGFALRWIVFLLFISMLIVIYVAFNNSNVGFIGLLIDFLLITISIYWINKRKTN
ncbi:MAG: hypothetical protein ACW981_08920 [Candidatus Hodarchaeales archaeon]